ncbi:uncharacterized protein LOC142254546 [Anomaloglossus baeobatrachus]|uniref:uncharacterized protein LOC142254546 n=1 Tax=Anomaloglossus baeobatrachus TaxID=238106 RepID=UPI003F4FDDD6
MLLFWVLGFGCSGDITSTDHITTAVNHLAQELMPYQRLPFVCRCRRKSFNQKTDKECKDSQKVEENDRSQEYTFPYEAQTQPQHCDRKEYDLHHGPADGKTSSSIYDKMDNYVKVTWQDTKSQCEKDELHHNTNQEEDNGEFTVTSNGFHLNLEINKAIDKNCRTRVIIINGKSVKKSRSYHDRGHQQSQHDVNHNWDFMEDSGKMSDMAALENKSCEKPLIKLEIIGEGIEVKYNVKATQNVIVHIDSEEQKNNDEIESGFALTNDYRSTEGSCSSYPVSDFSLNDEKEFCSNYRYPEWCVDVPPPPAEFADVNETFVSPEDEDWSVIGEEITETYSTSASPSSWSELETEPEQPKDDLSLEERNENHHIQYFKSWKQKPVKQNKTNLNQDPFMPNKEQKLNPAKNCHSTKSDCPLHAKVIRRKTFPQMYYDPYVACSNTRQSFFELEQHLLSSNPTAQRTHPHVSSVDLKKQLVSLTFLNRRKLSKEKDHNIIPLSSPKVISCFGQEDEASTHSNVSDPCENGERVLDFVNSQLDEDDDMMKHADEHIDFSESGFDEEMLDSDNYMEVQDISVLQNNQFLIQVTPPSRSSSTEHILGNNSNSRVPAECLQLFELSQPNSTEPENTNKKRSSVVTVVTGDLDQRVLIQGDTEAPSTGVQREPNKEFTSSFLQRDSVLTPVSDVDEPDSDNKIHSSFEEQSTLVDIEVFSQSAETFKPFFSMEQQTNISDESGRNEENRTSDSEQAESSNTSTRNSSDSAIPGTSFESITFQIPNQPKSDSEDNYSKHIEQDEEYLEKVESPIMKRNEKDATQEGFNKKFKLPKDLVLMESRSCEIAQEELSDRWAKKRKQFKEARNCNSAGGSSITSNFTEESGYSEETRSVDFASRSENKDKGLYTESFHSASWIFQGDDCSPDNSPGCLSKRPRSVAVRERTVRIAKGTGDYPWGFRIQFSKPILVTEVDTNGAAEEAGLQVGDIVMAVNGTDVTSIPHSEAASLARQGPDVLTLVVGSDISRFPNTPRPTCRGYLHKRTHSGLLKGWRKRWFVLKHDGSLHYYKHKKDEGKCRPLEVTKLEGSEIGVDTTLGKPFVLRCVPQSGNRIFYFCATSNQEMKRWLEAMDKAIHPLNQNHVWVDVTIHNISLPPLAIKNPECLGLLHQMDRNKDSWIEHYCILKDGCLYFYSSIRSKSALGGIYLQGYTVSEQSVNSRCCIIELRPPSEEFKTFYLSAGSAAENKRWITALKISINKWLPLHQAIQDFMSRPLEETRM